MARISQAQKDQIAVARLMGFPTGTWAGSRVALLPAYVHDGPYQALIDKQGDYATWKGVRLEFEESWDWIIPVAQRLVEAIADAKDTKWKGPVGAIMLIQLRSKKLIETPKDAYEACVATMKNFEKEVKVRTLVAMLENGPGVIPEGIRNILKKEGYSYERGKFIIEQIWSQAQDNLESMYGIYGQGLVTEIGNWCQFESEMM